MIRLLVRALARPTLVLGGLVLVLAGLGLFAQALVLLPVTPDPRLLGEIALGALGASLGLAVPVGVLAAVAEGGRRLRDDGAWRGLGTLGVPGRAWLVPLVGWLTLGAGTSALVAHVVEPWARATLRDARAEAAGRVELWEGRTTRVGTWSVAVDGGRLRFAGGGGTGDGGSASGGSGDGVIGSAGAWRFVPSQGAVTVELSDVDARSLGDGTHLTATTARVPIPVTMDGARVHVTELDTPALLARWEVHPPDAYERWIGWKRTVLPVVTLLGGLLVFPFALGPQRPVGPAHPARWPPLALTAATFVGTWAAVRLLDQDVAALGVPVATEVLLGGLGLAAAVAWATWGDR